MENNEILLKANALITEGNNEGFLTFCTTDVTWDFVGNQIIYGKEAVRQYMQETYTEPPVFDVEELIEAGDVVTATGKISMKDAHGHLKHYAYCDIWKFRDGQMAALRAFVIEIQNNSVA